ncbi:alpha/beta hydrolase family protein [Psychromonas hadalis]|uniref:alpha/beta hydrolase family protein n=1 Tax=Psychromonas hadalis TaxID=211669 RepID=UPI00146D2F77|nr:S9 family peptidase [Psychromonas hadalis]
MLGLIAVFFLSACSSPQLATHQSLINTNLPDLITVNDINGSDDATHSYQVSPDGKTLAWIGPFYSSNYIGGHLSTLFYKNLATGSENNLRVWAGYYNWMPGSKKVYADLRHHNEVSTLYVMDLEHPSDENKPVFELADTRLFIIDTLKDDVNHILFSHNNRDKKEFDLYRLNINTQKTTLLYKNTNNISGYVLDRTVKEGAVFAYIQEGKKILAIDGSVLFDAGENGVVQQVEYDKKSNALWLLANNNSDKIQLLKLDISSMAVQVVVADENVDISYYGMDEKYQPAVVVSHPGYQKFTLLDKRFQPILDKFKTADNVRVDITSSDDKRELFTIIKYTDFGSETYLYDLRDDSSELLSESRSLAFSEKLSLREPIQFTSRDGLTVNGYITKPNGVEAKNLPMVLLVHGGPMFRDYWSYSQEVQLLANRGYAVLQINYRGSVGYGKKFFEAGFGEFSKAMHNDLIDGVDWAIQEGIADPKKVAIMGASYGGYATLVGMTKTPEKFACGVDIFGMSDIELMSKNFPVHWEAYRPIWDKYIGSHTDSVELKAMREASPINYVEKIQAPILVIQGSKDIRVIPAQSREFVKKAIAAGKDIQYWEMTGVGHNYGDQYNQEKLRSKVDNFFAQCLGGQSAG